MRIFRSLIQRVFGTGQTVSPETLQKDRSRTSRSKSSSWLSSLTGCKGNRAVSVEEASPVISEKVSQPPMSGDELNEMCVRFSGSKDFQYALQAMRLSSINTKYAGVQYQLADIWGQVREKYHGSPPIILLRDPCNQSQTFRYLIRKFGLYGVTNSVCPISYFFGEKKDELKDRPVMILGDLSSKPLSDEEVKVLNSAKEVCVVEIPYFSEGITFLDCSDSPSKVENKLKGIVEKARHLPDLHESEAVKRVMNRQMEDNLSKLNNATVITPKAKADDLSFDETYQMLCSPSVAPEAIEGFLLEKFAEDPEMRALASKILSSQNGLVYMSPQVVMQKLKTLGEKLKLALSEQGKTLDDICIIGDLGNFGQAKSSSLITYMFKLANDIPDEKFMFSADLEDPSKADIGKGKALVHIDDFCGSGNNIIAELSEIESLPQHFDQIFICRIAGTKDGFDKAKEVKEKAIAKFNCSFLTVDDPMVSIFDGKHPIQDELTNGEKATLNKLQVGNEETGSSNFCNSGASLLWFYMIPDNTLPFIFDFGKEILDLPTREGGVDKLHGLYARY